MQPAQSQQSPTRAALLNQQTARVVTATHPLSPQGPHMNGAVVGDQHTVATSPEPISEVSIRRKNAEHVSRVMEHHRRRRRALRYHEAHVLHEHGPRAAAMHLEALNNGDGADE